MTAPQTTVSTAAARELLEDLVSISAPSGEEGAAAERLRSFFADRDREVWIDEVGNVRAPADDSVLLTSHIDTVPGDIAVRIEEDPADPLLSDADFEVEDPAVLWGRGSVDATGPLVAMAVAAVRTGVSFVGVVGEEVDSRGAWHLIEDRAAPEALINGEPSGWNGVTLGYRGMLAGNYEVESPAGHSSRPEPNAIETAMDWWEAVETAMDDLGGDTDSVFESITAKPTTIAGGPREDGLAVTTSMDIQFRIPPSRDTATVRNSVESVAEAGTVNWVEAIAPVMASPRTPVATALRGGIREHGGEPRLLRKTGTADVNIYNEAWDCPMATYGPGDSDLDHAPEERLPLAEFDRAIAVLTTACERLTESD